MEVEFLMGFNLHNKTISTKRLVLRMFQKSDAEVVTKLCDNFNIYKNTLYLPYPYTIKDAFSWIEHHLVNFNANKSYEFAITNKESGELVGAIGLSNNQKYANGEIGYWIGEEFWGNGYATEAAKAILKFAFNDKQYHKVFARYFNSNPSSGRVLQKIGMKQEGILIDHVKKENCYEDLVYCGIINSGN